MIHFFCFIPPNLVANYDFQNVEIGLFATGRALTSWEYRKQLSYDIEKYINK